MKELIEKLKAHGVLRSKRIEDALRAADRAAFVPEDMRDEAYEDCPLPIGSGQTISQPYTVVYMLELLDVQPGEKVLDVGSGSGWTTALLAHLVGEGGEVIGVERIPELAAFGRRNLASLHVKNARIEQAGAELGYPSEAPFNKILVSAAASAVPQALVNQLHKNGRMVLPVGNAIIKIESTDKGLEEERHEGFHFVPLIA